MAGCCANGSHSGWAAAVMNILAPQGSYLTSLLLCRGAGAHLLRSIHARCRDQQGIVGHKVAGAGEPHSGWAKAVMTCWRPMAAT